MLDKERIRGFINSLTPSAKLILSLSYGLNKDGKTATVKEMASYLNVTSARVIHIRDRNISILRSFLL